MSGTKPAGHLADYLHRRLQYLERCNAEIETRLFDDQRDLLQKIDHGEFGPTDPVIGQTLFHLEYVLGNTLRYAMLVAVCSFLEEAMKAITRHLVADYDSRIEGSKKRRENWLRTHIRILHEAISLDLTTIQSQLETFHDLITLRNCVVHAWGKLAGTKNPGTVQAAVSRIETVEVSRDGYLVFGDQVVPAAIIAAEEIAESVLTSKLQTTMT